MEPRCFPATNLTPQFQSALAEIAGRLRYIGEPWALGGSAMLAARGLAIPARDIDLFAEPAVAVQIASALGQPIGAVPSQVSATSPRGLPAPAPAAAYASEVFTHFQVAGIAADLVGGFARRHEAGTYRVQINGNSVDARLVGEGWGIPLLRAEEWLVVYWLQPKEDGREALLEQYLGQPGNLSRPYLERVLTERELPARVREQGRRFLAAQC